MRTILTLDDFSVQPERLRRAQGTNLKDLVNEALRRGLREMTAKPKTLKPFRTRAFPLGPFLINIDNVSGAIAHAEGQGYK
jgi:hypothetical protein